jgi:hypothetical protein
MNSILPSKQATCPSCGAYNPPGSLVCQSCGAKRDVPSKPDRGLLSSSLHFLLAIMFIVIGTLGLIGSYPPGKIRVDRYGKSYATTEIEVILFGALPLIFGALYLLVAIALKIKEKFFR